MMNPMPYVSWFGHGTTNFAPPASFTNVNVNIFAVAASLSAIQSLADRLLNPAGGGQVRYQAALPIAIFSFADAQRCTSVTEPAGWTPGRETMVLTALWEFRSRSPLPTRLVFWAPYIFIDYTIGLVCGREIWGWPKNIGKIGVAADRPGGDFSVETTIFRTLAPDTRGEQATLLRIRQTQPAAQPAPAWASGADAALGLAEGLLGGLSGDVLRALCIKPRMECVVLKQFRSSSEPKLACYQAIVNSPVALTNFVGGGPYFGQFTLEIATCESHPIVSDLLGRLPDPNSTTVPVKFAGWSTVDYEAIAGDEIVVRA